MPPWDTTSLAERREVIRASVARKLVETQVGPIEIVARWEQRLAFRMDNLFNTRDLGPYAHPCAVRTIQLALDVYRERFGHRTQSVPLKIFREILTESLIYGIEWGIWRREYDEKYSKHIWNCRTDMTSPIPWGCENVARDLTLIWDKLQCQEVLLRRVGRRRDEESQFTTSFRPPREVVEMARVAVLKTLYGADYEAPTGAMENLGHVKLHLLGFSGTCAFGDSLGCLRGWMWD
ncbi:hypothetical protein TWF481_011689 [Arthrobotrys musiformis]|uniref:Uncharacterized protein n=1 Tax=Arthrobotrys musiformis TaxID=47236 RepID=A0AAV9VZ60_9PEZI